MTSSASSSSSTVQRTSYGISPGPSMFTSPPSTGSSRPEDGTLFSQEMTIYQRNSSTLSITSTNSMKLLVEVLNHVHRREVLIRITNQNDFFFSYIYLIDSTGFDRLKQEKHLLMPFELFPQFLTSLLEKCAKTSNTSSSSSIASPNGGSLSHDKSSCILVMEYIPRQQLQLEILERNEFQTLPRLGFTMPAASDEYIHSRYRDGFQRLRRLNESLTGRVSSLEADVRSLTAHNGELLANYSTDLAAAESSVQEKTQQLEQRHREEKEKWLEAERTLKVRLSKVQGELRSREDTLAVERQESGESYNELKERYSQELAKKSGRIKELEERVRQCTAEMERQKSLRETTGQELKKCQLELEATKRDQSKANEIIRKLQEEVKASRDKVDILNQVTHKQEANLGVKESTLEKVQCQLRDSLQTLTKKRKEVDRLREELARCENKCSEHEIRIGANRLVIDRLNEQIEAQAKAMEKMRIGETQPKTTVVESKTRREETIQPESASPTRNGRNQFTLDRELARKSRPTTVTTNRGKNVDFRLDDNEEEEELLVDSNYRATTRTTSLHDLLEEERHLKNHLFAHTKERPQLKEVNFRTNQKTKGVGTNSANVMTMTFGGRRF